MSGHDTHIFGINEIIQVESETRESVWIVAGKEGVGDLDNDELLETVHANLRRGISYRIVLPGKNVSPSAEEASEAPFSSGHYQIRYIPKQLFDLMCPFQIHDAAKRHRRGFYSLTQGSDYYWTEMESNVLRQKIEAFKYLWDMPSDIFSAFKDDATSIEIQEFSEFDQLVERRITDSALCQILKRDYRSALAALNAGLWKLAYVCMMGIVETALDQILASNCLAPGEDEKNRTSFALKIVRAQKNGLLSESDAKLTHGLREIRNIVHPEAELRCGIIITKHHVEMARSFLKVMLEQSKWGEGI